MVITASACRGAPCIAKYALATSWHTDQQHCHSAPAGTAARVQVSALQPLLVGGLADEALAQVWLPPPRFAVMSTAGVLEVTRRRPLEVLKVRLLRLSQ